MKLVDNWRTWHRRWSVWLGAIGSCVVSFLICWPDAAITAWNLLPPDLRASIPPQYTPMIGVAIFMVSMLAQLFKQKKLQMKSGDDANS